MSGDNMIENFVESVRQNTEIEDQGLLGGFTLKKTDEGAAQTLRNKVAAGWKVAFPKARKEPRAWSWSSFIKEYFEITRLGQKRFYKIVELAGLEVVDDKLVLIEVEETEPEVVEATEVVEEESSEDISVSWKYDPDEEPEKTWQGFTAEEMEVIDIINAAYLRGHTPQVSSEPSFYTAHLLSLCRNEPMKVAARKKPSGAGYCANADGRYTGGLLNCAVTSARWGTGIMVPEEKEKVQKACLKACPNCPNKRWQQKSMQT